MKLVIDIPEDYYKAIKEIPVEQSTADMMIIRNGTPQSKAGRWIYDKNLYSLYKCTACNGLCTIAGWANCISEEQMYKTFKFCPNCGARMQAESEG